MIRAMPLLALAGCAPGVFNQRLVNCGELDALSLAQVSVLDIQKLSEGPCELELRDLRGGDVDRDGDAMFVDGVGRIDLVGATMPPVSITWSSGQFIRAQSIDNVLGHDLAITTGVGGSLDWTWWADFRLDCTACRVEGLGVHATTASVRTTAFAPIVLGQVRAGDWTLQTEDGFVDLEIGFTSPFDVQVTSATGVVTVAVPAGVAYNVDITGSSRITSDVPDDDDPDRSITIDTRGPVFVKYAEEVDDSDRADGTETSGQ
ncbi:MAG: hypothetical protein ACI8PZ_005280 [Myxococcota bacterium]|jgi:hypothetical protein